MRFLSKLKRRIGKWAGIDPRGPSLMAVDGTKKALEVVYRDNYHHYLSTACWHLDHFRCRKECKFCKVKCECHCHTIGTVRDLEHTSP